MTKQYVRDRGQHAQPGSVAWFLQTLRDGPYTSLGSYPLYWLCSDGEALSHVACMEHAAEIARAIRDNDNSGWRVVAVGVNWEDPALYCGHTNDRIPSAYAEDLAERETESDES